MRINNCTHHHDSTAHIKSEFIAKWDAKLQATQLTLPRISALAYISYMPSAHTHINTSMTLLTYMICIHLGALRKQKKTMDTTTPEMREPAPTTDADARDARVSAQKTINNATI